MVRRRRPDTDLRSAILAATTRLLSSRTFADLQVADVLREADVSRGSFYLYFENKHDVLRELARVALAEGQRMGEEWAEQEPRDARAATRGAIEAGARLWEEQAPVLRAVVETWPSDPALAALWHEQMDAFVARTAARIERDRAGGAITHHDVDATTLAAALTWAGERLYYLAATRTPPFDDRERLVAALTQLWTGTLYGDRP